MFSKHMLVQLRWQSQISHSKLNQRQNLYLALIYFMRLYNRKEHYFLGKKYPITFPPASDGGAGVFRCFLRNTRKQGLEFPQRALPPIVLRPQNSQSDYTYNPTQPYTLPLHHHNYFKKRWLQMIVVFMVRTNNNKKNLFYLYIIVYISSNCFTFPYFFYLFFFLLQ